MNKYSNKEKEIMLLHDILDILLDTVNNYRSELLGEADEAQIMLYDDDNQKIFLINILELLSEVKIDGDKIKYIDFLVEVIKNPSYGSKNIHALNVAVKKFKSYIDNEMVINRMWLPSIDTEVNLKIKASDLIYIAGNTTKHGVNRLNIVRSRIIKVLESNNIIIDEENSFIVIEEIQNWFFDDVINHQVTYLSQLLNDIKYGIYEYLLPEVKENLNTNKEEVKHFHWELMGRVPEIPNYFPKFTSMKLLTKTIFH